jgi:CHAT domain-containing protein/Tfp pilus assembly protein PilF
MVRGSTMIRSVALGLLLALAGPLGPAPARAQDAQRLQRARDLAAEAQQRVREGRYAEAIPRAREALAIREQVLGPTHPEVAQSLHVLATALLETGDHAAARGLHERALQIREQALGPAHPAVAGSLTALGYLLVMTGDHAAARPLVERALRIREQALGPAHTDVADSLNILGLALLGLTDYAAARPLLERALRIREQALGPDHVQVAPIAQNLGRVLRDTGDYAAARPLLERAVRVRERTLGPSHPTVAFSLSNLGLLLQLTGDYPGARAAYERALQIHEQARGPNHPEVASALGDLGSLLQATGDYAGARAAHERALRIREQALGVDSTAVAASLAQLGHLAYLAGDYAGARQRHERALRIREQRLGPGHRLVAGTLNELALVLHATGDYAGARPLYERALRILEQVLGPDHAQLAFPLTHLGRLLRHTGDPVAARAALERGLRIRERALGPTHPDVATSLDNLGLLLQLTGDGAGARAAFERSLRIREQALGPSHPTVALTLGALASQLQRAGRFAEARPLYERALAIREQALGADHPDVVASLHGLAFLDRTVGDHAAAQARYLRALPIVRTATVPELRWRVTAGLAATYERQGRLAEALPLYREAVTALEGLAAQFGEEPQRAQFLQSENRLWPYDALARLLLKLHERDSSRGHDREAWAVLETRKARVAADALAAARPRIGDPAARQEAERVQAKQQEALAAERALREEEARAPAQRRADRIQSLTRQLAETKTEYLAQVQGFLARYPRYRSQFVDQQTVDPKALAKFAGRLPAGTVAVQYFAAPDALYLFVVAAGGHFQVRSQAVSQQELYALIRDYRGQLEQAAGARVPWADDGSDRYRRLVAPFKATSARLAAHLLEPIQAELAAHPNVVFFPNDLLLYLPIHALTRTAADGTVRFLAETHAVSYVTQLELVDLLSPGTAGPSASVLAVANPDGSLPAASREVRELARIRGAVTTLEGPEATKSRFLGLVARHPDIHLATHGVLDPKRPELSYLLLAGDDETSQRLTIGDIAGLNLAPNALAILSGCETALGEQVPGAALVTLAAAFSQAGSQSIVASLWKVSDTATRDFMVALHRALPTAGRAGALQQAQLAVLRSPATAHPYYWAPFILIGAR